VLNLYCGGLVRGMGWGGERTRSFGKEGKKGREREKHSLLRLANTYINPPHTSPHTTMVAMGMEVAGWPRETPPTNITPSMPVVCASMWGQGEGGGGYIPSRRTVIMGMGKMNKTHFPLRVVPSYKWGKWGKGGTNASHNPSPC
jgi:hypothetical protein